mmetsp:Transcript_14342/g.41827  ORF Transcript_14342/g.41827 Transcript_14342/m.41827 type:complete len:286 (-) Transcript_14342:292-1149(-)
MSSFRMSASNVACSAFASSRWCAAHSLPPSTATNATATGVLGPGGGSSPGAMLHCSVPGAEKYGGSMHCHSSGFSATYEPKWRPRATSSGDRTWYSRSRVLWSGAPTSPAARPLCVPPDRALCIPAAVVLQPPASAPPPAAAPHGSRLLAPCWLEAAPASAARRRSDACMHDGAPALLLRPPDPSDANLDGAPTASVCSTAAATAAPGASVGAASCRRYSPMSSSTGMAPPGPGPPVLLLPLTSHNAARSALFSSVVGGCGSPPASAPCMPCRSWLLLEASSEVR